MTCHTHWPIREEKTNADTIHFYYFYVYKCIIKLDLNCKMITGFDIKIENNNNGWWAANEEQKHAFFEYMFHLASHHKFDWDSLQKNGYIPGGDYRSKDGKDIDLPNTFFTENNYVISIDKLHVDRYGLKIAKYRGKTRKSEIIPLRGGYLQNSIGWVPQK